MRRTASATVVALAAVVVASGVLAGGSGAASRTLPYENAKLPVRVRVADLLSRMTLEEKVGQMTQAERGSIYDDATPITTWKVGSVLSGGGSVPTPNTPRAWADMVDRFQRAALRTRLRIPIIYGIDSVHGDGNMLGATVFPHNIGLGATRDPELARKAAHVVAEETRASGPQWTFAPCVCVALDDRWGRTYESFGEDPRLVTRFETAIDGFQGPPGHLSDRDRVLATAKHYAGDGDADYGTSTNPAGYTVDQGVAVTSRRAFWRNSLAPYVPAVRRHDVGTVMPSYSSVDWTEDGVGNPIRMHANRELISGLLKGKVGFRGFVISDWEGLHQIPGDWPTQVRTAVKAGIDMVMEPSHYQSFETTLINEVNGGRVSTSRIDDAVRRILRKKFELGLFEHPFTDRKRIGHIGSRAHRALARRAVAKSQVLLKNRGHTLPLRPAERRVRGRVERGQHREPGGRLDAHLAGRLDERDPRHHDPRRSSRGRARREGDPQRRRLRAGAEGRGRGRGRGGDPVRGGVGRRGRPVVVGRPG